MNDKEDRHYRPGNPWAIYWPSGRFISFYHSISISIFWEKKYTFIRLCQKFLLMKDTSSQCRILFLCWQIFLKVMVKLCQGLMIWMIRHPGDHSSTAVALVHTRWWWWWCCCCCCGCGWWYIKTTVGHQYNKLMQSGLTGIWAGKHHREDNWNIIQ